MERKCRKGKIGKLRPNDRVLVQRRRTRRSGPNFITKRWKWVKPGDVGPFIREGRAWIGLIPVNDPSVSLFQVTNCPKSTQFKYIGVVGQSCWVGEEGDM